MPTEETGGFARTDALYSGFIDQLNKTKGFMICFVQLKNDKNEYFAPNQIGQFPALLCRYVYEDENNGEYTKFVLDAIRDPKKENTSKQQVVPCKYNFETKEVKTLEELDKEEKENKNV